MFRHLLGSALVLLTLPALASAQRIGPGIAGGGGIRAPLGPGIAAGGSAQFPPLGPGIAAGGMAQPGGLYNRPFGGGFGGGFISGTPGNIYGGYYGGYYGGGYYPYGSYYGNAYGGYFGVPNPYNSFAPAPPVLVPTERTIVLSNEFPATLKLQFPAAADVWLDGKPVAGDAAEERAVTSPVLKPGETFTFHIRARWSAGGKDYEYTRETTLGAGETSRLLVVSGTPAEAKK